MHEAKRCGQTDQRKTRILGAALPELDQRTDLRVLGETGIEQLISHREQASELQYARAMSEATNLGERLAVLTDERSREGYMAALEQDGDDFLLLENHCPICAAAQSCQNFCRSELALFQRLLGDKVEVTREEHILAGARRCAYRIHPK